MRDRRPDTRIYLAYGSNLNIEQMALRCPSARPVGTGILHDLRLAFRGGNKWGVLTVEPWEGKHVPVAAWEVTESDELELDRYEGYPSFYGKEDISLPITDMNGNETQMTETFLYVMAGSNPLGIPTDSYVDIVRDGYDDFGFDQQIIDEAIAYTRTLE